MDIVASIGRKIQELRKARGLTLQQVADGAGCSAAYVSQIENDKASPSINTMKRISEVLNVRIVDFFSDEELDEPVMLTQEQWTTVSLDGWQADVKQMVRSIYQKHMQPFFTTIEPGGGVPEPYSHVGQEFGVVLEGVLTLTVGTEVYQVEANSSFYYSSLSNHSWINEGTELCRVVWVISPPSW